MNSAITLHSIHVYPVKSCAGHAPSAAELDAFGLAGDRRWLITRPDGRFLTQRELPQLALVRPEPIPGAPTGGLRLHAPGRPPLAVPVPETGGEVEVTVWDSRCRAADAGEDAAAWLSRFLEEDCRLVAMHAGFSRAVSPEVARPGDQVSFADGFPLLLLSRASLEDLNARLAAPLPMDRFRPNLVVDGCGPFAEDGWRRIRVGGVSFRVVKPCARCTVTTVDQRTGRRGAEPLATLAEFRRDEAGRVLFGQNLIHEDKRGTLRVGGPVEVLEAGAR